MAAEGAHGFSLLQPLVFLGAACIAVPLFRKLRLGAVIGYLAAGVVIGPFGLGLISDAKSVLTLAELGVVLLLFIIGLELKPSRLWAMRKDIVGLGLAQVVLCTAVIGVLAFICNLDWRAAAIAGAGLALSSTAFAAPLMAERNELASPYGQRAFAVLLLQDLAIVPLIALVAFLAPPGTGGATDTALMDFVWMVAAVGVIVLAGLYLLNPAFKVLASTGSTEIMTASALLVVLGAAGLMQWAGMSMAMGAFLAGVLLAESNFRHELEADIQPFRGLLLGLFFIAVGMGIDLPLVSENLAVIAVAVILVMLVKTLLIWALARTTGSDHRDALRMGAVLSQGGEFAFVLFTAAAASQVMTSEEANLLTAIVTFSLVATPAVFAAAQWMVKPKETREYSEDFSTAGGSALIIGFGRFGQVVSQVLMAKGLDLTMIDSNVNAIDAASKYGHKIYFGDGSRLDVLRAAGAESMKLVAVCIDDAAAASLAVQHLAQHFPLAKVVVRSVDRAHSMELVKLNVDFQVRETFESAISLGKGALQSLGASATELAAIEEDVRSRDAERFAKQLSEGVHAGRELLLARGVQALPEQP
ncbi:monovalent cation:proton antiporter-2 (CPA2) family protein [Paucibacter sp. M5-1]|uniref:monovalent cation:proton antiporter-2 (CPA2) family protein n=1 Tax=Paucibacter sp. M5-1 TaxID=3015998 RepID=UPI0022B89D56|nr:monovalent cation:proton antiporter-2 (CPA2) family protein [Paucibacter sp. M5-1]MCZ7880417.1 monovalent cation:proton antiporter-2 (CPA2) family protein [Paucibacter sp. M5-1]